jgi:hypothetical protein
VNWLKKLFGIKTDFEIMLDHLRASHERDAELIRLSMGTIDRVVAARYDRPTLAQETPMQAPTINVDDFTDVNVDDDTWMSRQ